MEAETTIQEIVKRTLSNKGFLYVFISILFALTWLNTAVEGILLNFTAYLLFALVLPFYLLITVVSYESGVSYFILISLFVLSIFIEINTLIDIYVSYQEYGEDYKRYFSCSPISEFTAAIKFLCISFVALALLHNNTLTTLFNWKRWKFLLSIALGCLLFLITK